MEQWPSNPYFDKAMTREMDMFFGRRYLLMRLFETVAHRQSVSLVGPRGIGKSSLLRSASLLEVQAQFSFDIKNHIFVFLDLREYLQKTSEDFFHSVSKALIAQGTKRGLTLQGEGQGEDEYSSILDEIAEQGFFPVLLLDAFDKVTLNRHFDPEFFEFLRAHASIGLVSYVTASIAPLYEVCHSGIVGSPFFNIFYTYHLEALSTEEALALITIPAQRAGIPFTEAEIALIQRLAGRHPYFIQRVCYLLYEEKRRQDNEAIDEQNLKKQAYKELSPLFIDIWKELLPAQQMQLQDEAQQKRNERRELPELSESALFRQFVRNTCEAMLFRMTTEELDAALSKIDDLRALGNANLRLMKTVSLRLKESPFPSIVEKGIIIREVLIEAFESLRGSSTRADAAPEWRFYNILHYRYFKHHMKNEQIAARLGFSTRQYYRERDKALGALLGVLFDKEHNLNFDE